MTLEKIAPIVQVTPFNMMSDSYATFIQNVRAAVAGPKPDTVLGPKSKVSRPVLAKETSSGLPPPKWIHVVLNSKGGAAPTVAIHSDNAYIVGFTNSKRTWYQLSKTGTKDKLVDENPVMAGFDVNYSSLIGGGDKLPTLNVAKFRDKDDKPFQPFKGLGINSGEEALAVVALLKLILGSNSLLAWLKCFSGLLVKKLKREDTNYEKPKTAAIVNPL
jgi:hypothetical protein